MTIDELISKLETLMEGGARFEEILEASVAALHGMDSRFDWTRIYELFPDNVQRVADVSARAYQVRHAESL